MIYNFFKALLFPPSLPTMQGDTIRNPNHLQALGESLHNSWNNVSSEGVFLWLHFFNRFFYLKCFFHGYNLLCVFFMVTILKRFFYGYNFLSVFLFQVFFLWLQSFVRFFSWLQFLSAFLWLLFLSVFFCYNFLSVFLWLQFFRFFLWLQFFERFFFMVKIL